MPWSGTSSHMVLLNHAQVGYLLCLCLWLWLLRQQTDIDCKGATGMPLPSSVPHISTKRFHGGYCCFLHSAPVVPSPNVCIKGHCWQASSTAGRRGADARAFVLLIGTADKPYHMNNLLNPCYVPKASAYSYDGSEASNHTKRHIRLLRLHPRPKRCSHRRCGI